MKNKRGDFVFGYIVTIAVTIIFFVICFVFLSRASSGAAVYEQAYSKQIALIIDNARPNTIFEIDFSEGIEYLEKERKKTLSNSEKNSLVKIENNEVIVSLSQEGYSSVFFSDYDVSSSFNENKLVLVVT